MINSRVNRFIFTVLFLLLLLPEVRAAGRRFDIDILFDIAAERGGKGQIWDLTPADLPREWFGGDFVWSSSGGREFHYSCMSSGADLRFLGMPIAEADFFLAAPGGRFQGIAMVLCGPGIDFNRDADPDLVRAHICKKLGTEWMFPAVIGENGIVRLSATEWISPTEAVTMFDIADIRTGKVLYLGITFAPTVEKTPAELLKASNILHKPASRKKILLPLPAARQWDADYCVPAAASRIARYYGSAADCQMLAALTGCGNASGIELDKVDNALNGVSAITGLTCRILYQNPDYSSYPAIAEFFEQYNRTARSLGLKRFPLRRVLAQREDEISRRLTAGLSGMDRRVLREIRRQETENMLRFKRLVAEYTAAGKPLLWCVLVDSQNYNIAFHLRIIHGFSAEGEEFIWSDSMKSAAVEKSVNWEDAWDITAFLAVLEPASVSGTPQADGRTAF